MARSAPVPLTAIVRQMLFFSPFLFPAYFFRAEWAGVPFTLTELFIYAMFALWVFSFLQGGRPVFNPPKACFFWWYLLAGLLFFGASLGVLFAPLLMHLPDGTAVEAQRMALGVWKGWVTAPLLYFVVLTQVLRGADDVQYFLRRLVHGAVLVALLAYGYAWLGNGVTYDFRLAGFFESANYLSLYLLPSATLNALWVMRGRSSEAGAGRRWLDAATLLVLLHALFFTQSYAAILAFFGAILLHALYVAVSVPGRARRALAGLLFVGAILAVLVITQLHSPKFRQFLDFENRSSTTVRFEIYKTAGDLVRRHWLWGHGPGLFQPHYQAQVRQTLGREPLEWNIPHPHNVFLAFWLNAGLPGLLALFGFIALAHRKFTQALPALWAILLHGLFDTPFWKNDLSLIFWAVLGSILLLQIYAAHSSKNPSA